MKNSQTKLGQFPEKAKWCNFISTEESKWNKFVDLWICGNKKLEKAIQTFDNLEANFVEQTDH